MKSLNKSGNCIRNKIEQPETQEKPENMKGGKK
jgi:hypothetical protein